MNTPRNAPEGAKDATAADSGTHGGSDAREALSEDARLGRYGEVIWTTSKRDEGTISVTGANVVAHAVMAVADAEQAELRAELAKAKRGAKTLGEIIDKQCCMVLDVTGLHDWVDEDGDGDWGAIWDHLFMLRERAEKAEAERDRRGKMLDRVLDALSRYPRVCSEHPEGDVISCGWIRTVRDVQDALDARADDEGGDER